MLYLAILLPLAIIEVTAHGAVADDATSDSAAFRAAFAAAGSGDTVHAGAGTWDLPRIDNQSAVYLSGRSGITFDGEGPTTILKMAGGAHVGDYHIFHIKNGGSLTFQQFACDGNRSNITSADEQTHCFNLDDVDGFTGTDLTLSHAYGDGIRFIGSGPTTMRNVTMTSIIMDDNGRSGIAIAAGSNFVFSGITATNISDQALDIEPGGGAQGIAGLTLSDCYLGEPTSRGAVTMSLSGGTTVSTGLVVDDCVIDGGIHGQAADGTIIRNSVVNARWTDALTFQAQYTNLTMSNVRIGARAAFNGISTASVSASLYVADWTLDNVKITVDDGRAFNLDGGGPGRMTLNNVRIRGHHPFLREGYGIYFNTQLADGDTLDLAVVDVDIEGMKRGMIVQRGAASSAIEASASGVIDLDHVTGIGTFCDNVAQVTFDRTGLTVTATTPNSGCP